ncbi:hypothetical protein [Enterococcus sp. LJL90]
MVILIEILLLAIASALAAIGYHFRRGQWLRLIAGNTFNDQPKAAQKVAPVLGIVVYLASGLMFLFAFWVLYMFFAQPINN